MGLKGNISRNMMEFLQLQNLLVGVDHTGKITVYKNRYENPSDMFPADESVLSNMAKLFISLITHIIPDEFDDRPVFKESLKKDFELTLEELIQRHFPSRTNLNKTKFDLGGLRNHADEKEEYEELPF